MRRSMVALLVALGACAASDRKFTVREAVLRVREQVEFDQWPKDPSAPMYAGFDLLQAVPAELEAAQQAEDDFEYLTAWQVVTRSVKWRLKGIPLLAVCGVGCGTVDQTYSAMLATLASLVPAGERLKRDPRSPIPRVVGEDSQSFCAFCRGNVFIVFLQPPPAVLNSESILSEWDRQIQKQPSLLRSMEFVPRIQEVRPSRNVDTVKKDSKIVFTIKLEGESGFVPAGIEILESGNRQNYMLHTDALHLGITANAEGTFTLCLWVANRRQLAAVVTQKITVH